MAQPPSLCWLYILMSPLCDIHISERTQIFSDWDIFIHIILYSTAHVRKHTHTQAGRGYHISLHTCQVPVEMGTFILHRISKRVLKMFMYNYHYRHSNHRWLSGIEIKLINQWSEWLKLSSFITWKNSFPEHTHIYLDIPYIDMRAHMIQRLLGISIGVVHLY